MILEYEHFNDDEDEQVFFGCLAVFCGAAILQRLSHHSCACDGVPLLYMMKKIWIVIT